MSPSAPAMEARLKVGRPPEREKRDWLVVVAQHTRDDWPPPAWLAWAMVANGGDGCHETPGS